VQVTYAPVTRRKTALTLIRHKPFRLFAISTWLARFFSAPSQKGGTVKLTFAISVVALVLVAGTTTICMSGAVNDHTTEYGGVNATMEQLFNPHLKICR
jgi:hypothetical protein